WLLPTIAHSQQCASLQTEGQCRIARCQWIPKYYILAEANWGAPYCEEIKPDYLNACKRFQPGSSAAWSCLYKALPPMWRAICGEDTRQSDSCVQRIKGDAVKIACAGVT